MKKILCLVVVIVLILTITSCSIAIPTIVSTMDSAEKSSLESHAATIEMQVKAAINEGMAKVGTVYNGKTVGEDDIYIIDILMENNTSYENNFRNNIYKILIDEAGNTKVVALNEVNPEGFVDLTVDLLIDKDTHKVGYKSVEENQNNWLEKETQQPTQKPAQIEYDVEDLVTQARKVTLSDEYGQYTSRYPKINLESEYVDSVNSEIKKKCDELIDREIEYSQQGLTLGVMGMDYESYLNDDVLSVIVTYDYTNSAGLFSYVYNIDVQTGEKVENSYFTDRLQLTQAELDERITQRKLLEFTSIFTIESMNDSEIMIELYNNCIDKITAKEWNDSDVLYLNGNGDVMFFCLLPSLAGAEAYFHHLELYN